MNLNHCHKCIKGIDNPVWYKVPAVESISIWINDFNIEFVKKVNFNSNFTQESKNRDKKDPRLAI